MKPLNLDDLNRVGIHPLKTPQAVAHLVQACEGSELRYFVVNVGGIHDKAQLLERLAETLKFPDYFGHNWDALYDVLCDEEWFGKSGVVLVLKHAACFEKLAADDWRILHETLQEAIGYWRSSNLPFWVFTDHSGSDTFRDPYG
jgi:RNAse (barnase) inhibitor barstar